MEQATTDATAEGQDGGSFFQIVIPAGVGGVILLLIFCCCYCRNSSTEEEDDGPPKKRIPDPREFLNQRIVRKEQDGELRKGTVRRILNMEGINTMFVVDFDDGPETFRLIYNFIADDLWIEGQEETIAEQNGYVA